MDLQERGLGLSTEGGRTEGTNASGMHTSRDLRSVRSKRKIGKGSAAKNPSTRPGWAGRDRLCIEILLDNITICRTTSVCAEQDANTPFWGETFVFDEVPEFMSCTARVYRMFRSQAIPFASTTVPLTPSFSSHHDERFPLRDVSTEDVIGDLRVTVAYKQVPVHNRSSRQLSSRFQGSIGSEILYELAERGQLEEIMELYTRISIAEGSLLPQLEKMCRQDAGTNWSMLFRANSPLSKTVESSMRFCCGGFLHASLGRTVKHCFEETIELYSKTDSGSLLDLYPESIRAMSSLARDCWRDIYAAREAFPNLLRQAFSCMIQNVKELHPERESRDIMYKAVSSFVFLRLIGPALIQPQLFGLSEGLPQSSVQKTLKTMAKILHVLSTLTDKELSQESDLSVFAEFMQEARAQMLDFLASCADPFEEDPISATYSRPMGLFLRDRANILPKATADLVPVPTAAGPLDVAADTAMLLETLWERRNRPERIVSPGNAGSLDLALQQRLQALDELLHAVHLETVEVLHSASAPEQVQTPTQPPSTQSTAPPTPAIERQSLRDRLTSPRTWKLRRSKPGSPSLRSPGSSNRGLPVVGQTATPESGRNQG
ncbi:Rho GTPase activation protein [Naematelia encephala]|uniref:Rho GTPase activation protein n=1 Tax=Naematelia encephala TaxID=71784 RepID=A0A1Y2BL33_9TREE|nr:Rho GTPase activation protein [Naematelia encephala]